MFNVYYIYSNKYNFNSFYKLIDALMNESKQVKTPTLWF